MTTTTTLRTPAEWATMPTASRDAQAYEMRLRGDALDAIRAALGYGQGTGTVSRAIRREMARRGGSPAVPANGRAFGVEIEVVGLGRHDAVRALAAFGAFTPRSGYNHDTPRPGCWKVVYDGSLGGADSSTCEVVSPVLRGEAGYEDVRRVMAALRAAGARIDRRCGLHVHHEVVDFTGAELGALVLGFAALQPAMDRLVAPSRRGGNAAWCGRLSHAEAAAYADRFGRVTGDGAAKVASARSQGLGGRPNSRYRTLNVHSFGNYGTVEFRQHQGTLNGAKAVAWIKFGQAVIEAAATGVAIRTDEMLADLTAAGKLDAATATYLANRQAALTH
jgi:hypothetical protein